jgi:alanine-synthesizing transaminase
VFSSRTRFDLRANRLSQALAARRAAGLPILDLTESNPTKAGLDYPEDLLQPLADAAALRYEPAALGLIEARNAVAADYRRRGFDLASERILLTASTSEAYAFLFKLLCDPGEAVLVPRPSYPLFEFLAKAESVRVERYPLAYDGEWHLTRSALESSLTRDTRAVVVVNPNNPTGSYLKREEQELLHAFCAERRLALIADEVFADYSLGEDARRVLSFADDGPALAFSLGGLSKSCGLPQLKLGWIAMSGPALLREEALARLEIVADTYLSVGTPVQRAAPGLLARLPELQAPITARVRGNLKALRERASGSRATLLRAEGGWYAVVQVPATVSEEERVCRLLEERGVLVHPGFFFDFEREAYLVLSLLPPPAAFLPAIEAILAD